MPYPNSIDYRSELVGTHLKGLKEGRDEVMLAAARRGLSKGQQLADIADMLGTTEAHLLGLLAAAEA